MSIYQDETSHDTTLLKLAKLDFNLVQSLHKEELSNIARWWKELDFATKLPFARDRLVEGYFWILGVYFEPQYVRARRILTKTISMTSIIDDIYDAYGTFEELELFTEAIERWDINSIDHLPEYMKHCYVALLDVYKEIEEEMEKKGNQYRVQYAIEAMKNLVRAYFHEAKWFHEGRIPTMEEYMRIALVTSGYYMLTTILSLFEQKRGHVASGIECYMKQYGASEEEGCALGSPALLASRLTFCSIIQPEYGVETSGLQRFFNYAILRSPQQYKGFYAFRNHQQCLDFWDIIQNKAKLCDISL
ncbi:hypothetical protein VitviT2T_029157 [Vitis vinifera]|uniref:Terpene synthase metal-binding domain-containing protein n=1 Tax=Vitis vinifera TaxID=29760 RepID=A0ABY9DXN5_VITVI|nr:hypothetical protein VitviT2T_029157 [Vitis vinifera]